jgi:heptosyltransferase-2
MEYQYNCRWFSGYKPCHFKRPCGGCPHFQEVQERIAIVSLEAMGAVLRSTCLLPAIKRRYPQSHITWITLAQNNALLAHNPYIDRLLIVNDTHQALLRYLHFDILYAVDKSLAAGALAEEISAEKKYGFGLTRQGVIRPLNPEAQYQYDVGLDDELKFFRNQKPETQQLTESMGLGWERDPYVLALTEEEKAEVATRRARMRASVPTGLRGIIGYNTGCSELFPYKKFTISRGIELIGRWRRNFPEHAIALLGGGALDQQRQAEMKAAFADDPLVINTPCSEGLRSGILWEATADMIFTGCTLGMHIAIALEKKILAWFGVSCAQEVDLYERGIKLQAEVGCAPCWKKRCEREVKCFDKVNLDQAVEATGRLMGTNSFHGTF